MGLRLDHDTSNFPIFWDAIETSSITSHPFVSYLIVNVTWRA